MPIAQISTFYLNFSRFSAVYLWLSLSLSLLLLYLLFALLSMLLAAGITRHDISGLYTCSLRRFEQIITAVRFDSHNDSIVG
jgi:hypothetical protein